MLGADVERGVRFVLGALKQTSEKDDQIGGLSVDTEGLAVASVSAMGGWLLPASMFALMFGMGLALVPDDFRRIVRVPGPVVAGHPE